MEYGFKNPSLDIRMSADGLNFVLLEDLVYVRTDGTTLRAPRGSTSDGLSVPQAVSNIISRTGKLLFSGVIHDAGFRGVLEVLTPKGNWMPLPLAFMDEEWCNDLIKECAESQGGSEVEVQAIYRALNEFGWRAFSEDRKSAPVSKAP